MVTIYDVDVNMLIEKAAEELKHVSEIKAPEWGVYVKTGNHKERPPTRADWWFVRAGAVLLKVQNIGPIGVSKLRVKYGGKKNRGHKPGKFVAGSGSVLRKVLQQLEKAGLIEQVSLKKEEKGRKGRVITGKGMKLLNVAAKKAAEAVPKKQALQFVAKPVVAKPVVAKPVVAKPVEAKPVEAKPVEAKPVEAKLVEAKLVEAKLVEAKPVEAKESQSVPQEANAPKKEE